MREESVVVASRAGRRRGDVPDTRPTCMCGDKRAKVDLLRADGFFSGELLIDICANLVAVPTNRRTEMDAKFRRGITALGQGFDSPLHDASCGSSPTGVEKSRGAGRVRDKYRNAVRNTHCQ